MLAKVATSPSLARARELLAKAATPSDARRVRAIAQAVAASERGKEVAVEASEIVLRADAKIGELTRKLPQGKARPGQRSRPGSAPKRDALAGEGLTKTRAAECERISDFAAAGGLERYLRACRKAKQPATVGGALALARLPPDMQKVALSQLPRERDVRAAVARAVLRAERARAEALRSKIAPLPDGPFDVIVVDPPWKYRRDDDAWHKVRNPFPSMTLEEIRALPVASLASDDAIVWLWTTNAFVPEAYACLAAWGFQPRTLMTWDKISLGLGRWLRSQTEHAILATRGDPPIALANQRSIIRERRREHARKPDGFYALVESLSPGGSKLEMFSRSPRNGWVAWGAEVPPEGRVRGRLRVS